MHRMRRFIASLVLAALPIAAAHADAPAGSAEQFDCADAFDLIAMTVMIGCSSHAAPPAARERIAEAKTRLLGAQLATPEEFAGLGIAFCPLMQGTGMLPAPDRLYLDDGLQGMSVDGLAEIIAHELEHRRQFRTLGERGFKCAYVRDMSACGACQDRGHPLEREAYERQDRARERLISLPPP